MLHGLNEHFILLREYSMYFYVHYLWHLNIITHIERVLFGEKPRDKNNGDKFFFKRRSSAFENFQDTHLLRLFAIPREKRFICILEIFVK